VVTGGDTGPTTILDGFTVTAGFAESPFLPQWSGGGMYNDVGSPTVSNCTFVGNSASYSGAGMYNYQSNPTLINCTFAGNDADYGGGMENVGSHPTLINCVFTGNFASGVG
jgi:parallel beta-helix repeat protein